MEEIKVLDHGFVRLVEMWGSDERIIESARMSTQKGFEGWGPKCPCSPDHIKPVRVDLDGKSCERCGKTLLPGDEKLLAYLWKNGHVTPFEMCGATFEVQAPIFVFREWHRHRAAGYSEMSARYAPLPDVNYVPSVERLLVTSETNRQAGTLKGAPPLTREDAEIARDNIQIAYQHTQEIYEAMLMAGCPKEVARVVLPVGRYSRMRATSNLRMWCHFLGLRNDANAQWEIRQFALAVEGILAGRFPRTISLFRDGRKS